MKERLSDRVTILCGVSREEFLNTINFVYTVALRVYSTINELVSRVLVLVQHVRQTCPYCSLEPVIEAINEAMAKAGADADKLDAMLMNMRKIRELLSRAAFE